MINYKEFTKAMGKENDNIYEWSSKKQISNLQSVFEIQKKSVFQFLNLIAAILNIVILTTSPHLQANNHKIKSLATATSFNSKKTTYIFNKETIFKGKIISQNKNEPVENAEVIFVTFKKVFKAYTLENGTFSINIPTEFINEKNIIKVNYNQIKKPTKTENLFLGFESADFILTKKDINSNYQIKAEYTTFFCPGAPLVNLDEKPNLDIYYYNGVEIKNQDNITLYNKYIKGKRENIDFYIFDSKIAKALYNKEDIDRLYIVIDHSK